MAGPKALAAASNAQAIGKKPNILVCRPDGNVQVFGHVQGFSAAPKGGELQHRSCRSKDENESHR
ncbi:MAG TPA: hypothetical protein VGP68_08835 [Gemmataceae bacterium]|jgi:hypothetical protein|nr:hypothetical protein [Gemmataceae bacterium]